MGIFNKLSTVIKSNINDLISRAENPEKMLNQIILDMRDQLAKAKREVAAAIADERKLKAQLEQEVKQQRDWQHRAMLAVKEGRDDLAKQARIDRRHEERCRDVRERFAYVAEHYGGLHGKDYSDLTASADALIATGDIPASMRKGCPRGGHLSVENNETRCSVHGR